MGDLSTPGDGTGRLAGCVGGATAGLAAPSERAKGVAVFSERLDGAGEASKWTEGADGPLERIDGAADLIDSAWGEAIAFAELALLKDSTADLNE